MPTTFLSDAATAYLFQCRNDAALFAVSLEETASNIPRGTAWYEGWRLCSQFTLGLAPPGLGEIAQPAARGVRSVGYYIWRNGPA